MLKPAYPMDRRAGFGFTHRQPGTHTARLRSEELEKIADVGYQSVESERSDTPDRSSWSRWSRAQLWQTVPSSVRCEQSDTINC
uniref:Uncharacterized protein n=1 Tax=Anopheles darlingi TaxID=43151 RepID=A0A2M4CPK9_ANODA